MAERDINKQNLARGILRILGDNMDNFYLPYGLPDKQLKNLSTRTQKLFPLAGISTEKASDIYNEVVGLFNNDPSISFKNTFVTRLSAEIDKVKPKL